MDKATGDKGVSEILNEAVVKLAEAEELLSSGDKGSATDLTEIAVRNALTAIEKANGIGGYGKKLKDRIALFTDDIELINACKVIEDLFNPAIYPVGLDHATEEPSVSVLQAAGAIEYAKKIIEFISIKIQEIENG